MLIVLLCRPNVQQQDVGYGLYDEEREYVICQLDHRLHEWMLWWSGI